MDLPEGGRPRQGTRYDLPCWCSFFSATAAPLLAQGPVTLPRQPLPDGPLVVDTAEEKIRVTVMKGLSHPWSLAFLPNGDMLVTERNAGRLRIVRGGVLDPQPISRRPGCLRRRSGRLDGGRSPSDGSPRTVSSI